MGFGWLILQAGYTALPGAIANMLPPMVKKVNFLNYPVDFGKKIRGKPLFGKNKTFRGFFFGIIGAILSVWAQTWLYKYELARKLSLIPYNEHNVLVLGFLIGFGVLFGDLIESFLKRRTGRKPGARWIPWDQLDLVIGGLLFLAIVYVPPWEVILIIVIGTPLLHIGFNHIGYWLGLQKDKW